MNSSDTNKMLNELIDKVDNLTEEINNLKLLINNSFNIDIDSNWISISELSNAYGLSYQAVHKKVHSKINPNFIKKINGVLSIPKRLVNLLEYKERK